MRRDADPRASETITVEPEKNWLAQNYVFKTATGDPVGRFQIHIGKPNTFDGAGLHLDLGQEGFLAPRFFAMRRHGLEIAGLRHNVITGAFTVEAHDEPPVTLERRGLVLPSLRVQTADGQTVLEARTTKLLGREFVARLTPHGAWSREDLLALLALLFHAKVSLTILYTAVGGTGVLAPI